MRLHRLVPALVALCVIVTPLHARTITSETITNETITRLITGVNAEAPELAKVAGELKELNGKIKSFRECYGQLQQAGQVVGASASGFKAKAITRARCGATSDEGLREDRQKLLNSPEDAGARAAGMDPKEYARVKELATMFLGGSRAFPVGELKVLKARATDLSNALGLEYASADNGASGSSGSGGGIGSALGNAIGGQMRMFTPDMTWAYVTYLNSILYISGATMFESDYKPGEWTRWEIADASQPDQKLVLERGMIRRDADKSEWWHTKTISVSGTSADTIVLESQMRPSGTDGLTMTVVRMRGKFPGDSVGKELMVPQNMQTISPQAFSRKPTVESMAGATVGTEAIRVGSSSYMTRHVRFGSGGGDMDWWLSDKAPGGLVRVSSTANGQEGKWTMSLTGSGKGARSELGMK